MIKNNERDSTTQRRKFAVQFILGFGHAPDKVPRRNDLYNIFKLHMIRLNFFILTYISLYLVNLQSLT